MLHHGCKGVARGVASTCKWPKRKAITKYLLQEMNIDRQDMVDALAFIRILNDHPRKTQNVVQRRSIICRFGTLLLTAWPLLTWMRLTVSSDRISFNASSFPLQFSKLAMTQRKNAAAFVPTWTAALRRVSGSGFEPTATLLFWDGGPAQAFPSLIC